MALMKPRVLVIDDDLSLLEAYTVLLDDEFQVYTAATGEEGIALVQRKDIDVLLLDLRLPGMDGLTVLCQLKTLTPSLEILIVTAVDDVRMAVEALRGGAADYLVKPVDNEVLLVKLRQLAAHDGWRGTFVRPVWAARPLLLGMFIGRSAAMHQLVETIQDIADTDATVLITGETGVGKELVAHVIHQQSLRRQGPFVAVNCATLTAALAASELFGHEYGCPPQKN